MTSSILVLLASLVTQWCLGAWWSETDYGVLALALACSDFLMVVRDGGVMLWLSRLSSSRFERLEGHAFWLATGCSVVTALLLAGLSFLVGGEWVYGDKRITTYLLIVAASFPWSAYGSVALAKLHVQLRFRAMSVVKLVSALVRYSVTVALAFIGWGALSVAFAFVAVVFIELILYFWLTRIQPWLTRPSWKWSAWIFQRSRWSLGGSLANAILRTSDYAMLGLVATSTAVVGVYFFAYQLTMQPVSLFSESLRRVVLPTFSSRFKGAEDQARLLTYVGVFLGGIATIGLLGLGVTAGPFERLLWGGKWTAAVRPIQLLALAMPLHLASMVVEMLAQSQGRFRLWTITILVRGVGFGAAALLAGWLGGASDPTLVAGVMSLYIGVSAVIEILVLMRGLEVSVSSLFQYMIPPYVCAVLLAVPLMFFDWPTAASAPVAFLARGSCFVIGLILLWSIFSRRTCYALYDMAKKSLSPGEKQSPPITENTA